MFRMSPKNISRFFLVVFGTAFGLVTADFLSRHLWPQFALSKIGRRSDLSTEPIKYYKASDELGWEKRSTPEEPLDDLGFVTKDLHQPAGKHAGIRMVLLGDSVADELTYLYREPGQPDPFETELSRAWGTKLRVWNHAVAGYGMAHYERILRTKGDHIQPDVVLILFCLNDLYSSIPVVWEGKELFVFNTEKPGRGRIFSRLFALSHLYRTLCILHLNRPSQVIDKKTAANEIFRSILKWCEERQVRLFAVVFPYFKPFELYTETEKKDYRDLLNILSDGNVPFLDLRKQFSPKDWSIYRDPRQPAWDYVHPNEIGNKEATRYILDFLARQRIE